MKGGAVAIAPFNFQNFQGDEFILIHGEYRPSSRPPQALKRQCTRALCRADERRKLGPTSRIQESSCDISTTRTAFRQRPGVPTS